MSDRKRTCGLILENREGKVLLQLRDDKSDINYPNCWGTFGGHVEEGETPEQAVVREIREELGYELTDPEYLGIFPFKDYDVYVYRKVDPHFTLDGVTVTEGQKGRFFSLEEMQGIVWAANCKEIFLAYFKRFH